MKGWQLNIAVRCGWVARVEVLALRCCGYQVRVILHTGRVRVFGCAPGGLLWPALALLKTHLRRCGVRQVLLLQPENHDEIIGRPALIGKDPGLWIRVG